jgi:phenylpyruvate tautomerase PptA (4-oxalocrotonate tautomerase family)
MPILDIRLIGPVPNEIRPGLAQRLAEAAGVALASRPKGTWVTLHLLDAEAYAENAGGPPAGAQPVLVSVLQAEPPQGQALAEQAARLAQAIAEACGRPVENVHLIFEPPARGRVAFGGRLLG